MTKNSICVTFEDDEDTDDHYAIITSDFPAIPDEHGRVKPVLDALLKTGFTGTHRILYKEARSATLIRNTVS
jgi:hypothetical protein